MTPSMSVFCRHAKTEVKVLDEANSLCVLSHGLEKPVYLHIKQLQIEAGLGQLLSAGLGKSLPTG